MASFGEDTLLQVAPLWIDGLRGYGNLKKFRGGWRELVEAFGKENIDALHPSTVTGNAEEFLASVPKGTEAPIEFPGRVGLGTYKWNGGLGEAFNQAPFLDTAETYGYGRVEIALGKLGVKIPVCTKISRSHMSYNAALNAIKRSRDRLKVDQIFLIQIHWPVAGLTGKFIVPGAVDAFQEAIHKGWVKHWGVCNHSVGQLEHLRLMGLTPKTVQVRYSPAEREIESVLIPYCKRRGIKIMAYSPFAQGKFAEGYTPAQTLNWILAKDGVVAIPATNSLKHLQENLKAGVPR